MSKDDKILLVIQKCENNYGAIKLSNFRASMNEKYCCRNSWRAIIILEIYNRKEATLE